MRFNIQDIFFLSQNLFVLLPIGVVVIIILLLILILKKK